MIGNIGKLDLFLKLLKLEAFRANLKGDRGGATVYGVASKVWPKEYATLEAQGWNLDQVFMFYNANFMADIARFRDILRSRSEVARLLFLGKVHGSGYPAYTRVIQEALVALGKDVAVDRRWGPQTAQALLSLGTTQYEFVLDALRKERENLAEERVRSVGLPQYARGITNRVNEEFDFAFEEDRAKFHRVV